MAGALWDLTLSWYFNISSPSLGPLSSKEVTATLIHQRLVLQDKVATCSSETQVSLSVKASEEHL